MRGLRIVWILTLLVLLPLGARGQESLVRVAPGVNMDEVGLALRRALTAWEFAAANEPPQKWALATLSPNRSLTVCQDVYLLMQDSTGTDEVRLLVVDASGPMQATFRPGDERRVGAMRLLLLPRQSNARGVDFLVRAAEQGPLLLDGGSSSTSPTQIQGFEEQGTMRLTSRDPRALRFAEAFLMHLGAGADAEEAAALAREEVPPPNRLDSLPGPVALPSRPEPIALGEVAVLPDSAMVTLRLVRGEASSLRALSGSMAYDSAGRAPSDPRVRAETGPQGGAVSVGVPGDRFRGTLHALEREGKLNVDSESMVRVPIGGTAFFRFDGPSGGMNGIVSARRVGRNQVELTVDQQGGDWGFLGAVSTRVRFADGDTRVLAQSSTSRTSSSSSGAPIISQIPYVGPATGSSQRSQQQSNYALFATVHLE